MGEGVLTTGFWRRDGVLVCEDVPLTTIARAVGTPTYVYSSAAIRTAYGTLATALAGLPVHIHYAMKANSNLAVLRVVRGCGAGVDVVSAGELHRARLAGFEGRDIVFAGVGKTRTDLEYALDAGVQCVNVESEAELEVLSEVAIARGAVAPSHFVTSFASAHQVLLEDQAETLQQRLHYFSLEHRRLTDIALQAYAVIKSGKTVLG